MFNSHHLFKKRLSGHLKETGRYLRYIFNGHMAAAMFFFISAIAFYYQQWLANLPENFPTAIIMGVTFGLILSYSPVRTLLKEPDLVFLIAAEQKMGAFFRNALIYSYVIQIYLIFLVAAALGPLFFASFPERLGQNYLLMLVVLLVFKGWNLLANWWMLKINDKSTRYVDQFIRFLLNSTVFYFFVAGKMVLASVVTVLFIIVFLAAYVLSRRQIGINWSLLVEKDQQRMHSFYRLANMFTDVPHLKSRVKKRHWLVSAVTNMVPFQNKATFTYLYRITFIRSGDYLDMYIRLIIVGGVAIWFVPNFWMKLLFAFLFLYMSSFQMMALFQHHRTNMWLDIYPVDVQMKQRALLKWLLQLALLQTILFAFVFLLLHSYQGFFYIIIGGVLFNYVFIHSYVKRKIAKT